MDDSSIQELSLARGAGQRILRAAFRIFGTPFAKAKEQDLAQSCDFIGLIHHLAGCMDTQIIEFEPLPALVDKRQVILMSALTQNCLTPGHREVSATG